MMWLSVVVLLKRNPIRIPRSSKPAWIPKLNLRAPDGAEVAFAAVPLIVGWATTSFIGGLVRWVLMEYTTPGPVVAVQVFIWFCLAAAMAAFLRRKTSALAAKTVRGAKTTGKWGSRVVMGGGATLLMNLGLARLAGMKEQELDAKYRQARDEIAERMAVESDDPLVRAILTIRNRYRSNYMHTTASGSTSESSEEERLRQAAAAYERQRRQAEEAEQRLRAEAARAAAAREMAMKFGLDFYTVLGVESSATDEKIKAAYRAAARANHPDRSGGDPTATARFRLIQAAYETLGDPQRRREYDELLLKAAH